jgi:hypothetical protein
MHTETMKINKFVKNKLEFEAFIKKNYTHLLLASIILLSSIGAANYVLPSTQVVAKEIRFQDSSTKNVGMTLYPDTHQFEIHNPSGKISAGTYTEYSDFYSIKYDQGLGDTVPKYENGVLGPNGEKWEKQ